MDSDQSDFEFGKLDLEDYLELKSRRFKSVKSEPKQTKSQLVALSFLESTEKDLVTFNFPDGKSLRVPKIILSTESPVFEAMFGQTWKKDSVEMNDSVDFDQYLIFKQFLIQLFELEPTGLNELRMDELMDYFFYANMYQTRKLRETILDQIKEIVFLGSISEFEQCIQFASAYNISDFMSNVVETILKTDYQVYHEFDLKEINEFLAIEKKYNLPGFTDKFIDALLRRQPPEDTKTLKTLLQSAKDTNNVEFKSKILEALYGSYFFYGSINPDELRSLLIIFKEFNISEMSQNKVLDKFIEQQGGRIKFNVRQYMTIAIEYKLETFIHKLSQTRRDSFELEVGREKGKGGKVNDLK